MSAQAFLGPALGWLLSASVMAMPLLCLCGRRMLGKRASRLAVSCRQIGRVGSGLSRPGSRLAALGWRHGHASVAAVCWAIELVGSLNNTSGEEDLDIVHEQ